MAQNQQFDLLKMLVEFQDNEMYQLCMKLREQQKIPHNNPKIPDEVCAKVDKKLDQILTSCKKDIDENYEDFIAYLGKRAGVKNVRGRLFSVALHTSLMNMKSERGGDENEI